MAHISLYRKYRPASFEEVLGQEHVTRTLANAIATGKVSHAYLFAGSRGTGKTSTAKLLAKALNCVEGPTASPCGICGSCRSISAGSSLDVIEMDAASNRGIDDIRDIRDRVAFASVEGRYRVYILDEVHMLTKEASNAFLKVLEEPPEHVIFVLCTTEAHKVIATIQSRCQKFEFRRPDAGMVLQVLQRIVDAEELAIEEAGLSAIARGSGGAFRDAIGVLDQLATYCGGNITLQDVLAMLGTVEADLLFEAVDIVAQDDVRGALLFVDRLAAQGGDFAQYAQELIGHLRNVFLIQQMDGDVAGLISLPEEDIHRLQGQARILPPTKVLQFVELLTDARSWMKQGNDSRLQLELAFIRITRPQVDDSTRSLINRVKELEQQLRADGSFKPLRGGRVENGRTCRPEQPPAEEPSIGKRSAADPSKDMLSTGEACAAESAAETPSTANLTDKTSSIDARTELTQVSLDKVSRAWPVILDQVKKKKIPLYSILQEGRPVELESDLLVIGFPPGTKFQKTQLEKVENQAVVVAVLEEITGAKLRIASRLAEGITPLKQPAPNDESIPTTSDVIELIKNSLGAEEIT